MKKRLIFSLVAMSLIPILASCNSGKGGNTSNINSITNNTSTNSEEGNYNIKDIDVYRKNNVVDKKINIRFYTENPNVPYIGIKEYFKEFYNTEFNVTKEDNFYNFKKNNEPYIKIDTKNEIIEIKGLDDLSRHPDFVSSSSKTFLKLDSVKKNNSQFKIIDLNNYDILTYGSNNDAYVPITLLGNMCGGMQGYNVAYNGKSLYVMDFYGQLEEEIRNEEYYSNYYEILLKKNDRFEDLAKYNYNQLCFTFDNLRGYTSQLVFKDHNLQTIGLNAILETYYPDIKKMLLSTNKEDYEKGLLLLFVGLFDGGHTGMISKNPPDLKYYEEFKKDPRFKELVEKAMSAEEGRMALKNKIYNAKQNAFNTDYASYKFAYFYNEEYKTAFIQFDRFVVDARRWDEYYKGNKDKLSELENPGYQYDTYAFVRKSLYDAKAAGAENVIFDFTSNGGGDIDAVMGVLGLINGAKASQYASDIVDKTRIISNYSVDINLDGKFDEEDVKEAKSFNFKIAGLTTKVAFSSGNYLPSLMKSKGFKMLGEKSGGGTCGVSRESTADGFLYLRSGFLNLTDEFGNNLDDGVDVDYSLVSKNGEGYYDLSKLYDAKIISEYLKKI